MIAQESSVLPSSTKRISSSSPCLRAVSASSPWSKRRLSASLYTGMTMEIIEVRGQKSGIRSQESGIRRQESGIRSERKGFLTPDSCPLAPYTYRYPIKRSCGNYFADNPRQAKQQRHERCRSLVKLRHEQGEEDQFANAET